MNRTPRHALRRPPALRHALRRPPALRHRGQGMTEYVILLVAIAIVCTAITVQFGGKIQQLFETADEQIDMCVPCL